MEDINPTVRSATIRDVDDIVRLINEAYQVEKFFVEGERTQASEVLNRLETGFFLVLEFQGSKKGLAAAVYARIHESRGSIELLSVNPQVQGQGLGRRLLGVLEAFFEAQGCSGVDLEVVNLREELEHWYRSLGYQVVGKAPFVSDQVIKMNCHFVKMSKELSTFTSMAAS